MRTFFLQLAALFLLTLALPASYEGAAPTAPPEYTFTVVHEFPHDANAFTQGLAFRDGFLYEGTGQNGRSSLRKVRIETGEVVQHADLAQEYFGEGIALV